VGLTAPKSAGARFARPRAFADGLIQIKAGAARAADDQAAGA
jgi:hypothetical protein